MAVNTLVIGQIFYLLNSRFKTESSLSLAAHLGNPYLPLGIAAVIVLQPLFTYAQPFHSLFGTEAIPLDIWPRLFAGGLVFFLVVEAEKWVIRRFGLAQPKAGAPLAATPATGVALPGKWQALLGALAVAGLIGGEVHTFWNAEREPAPASATTTAATAPRDVFAAASGTIAEILCDKGAAVKAGEICARLDGAALKDAVTKETFALTAAEKQQRDSIAALASAKRDVERRQGQTGRAAAQRLERARAALERAQARADADAATVEAARAILAAAQTALTTLEVAAPMDGVIVSTATVGDVVAAGMAPAAFSIMPNGDNKPLESEKTTH